MDINNKIIIDNSPSTITKKSKLYSLDFLSALGLGFLFLVIQLIVFIPVVLLIPDTEETQGLVMPIGLSLAFIIAAWCYVKLCGLSAKAYQWKPYFWKLIPLGFFLILGSQYVIGEFMTYLPRYDTMLASYKEIFEGISLRDMIISVVLIGPVCEEIIFRGIILEGLSQKYNTIKALIFSSLIFGLIHFQPLQIISAFFAGLIFGWIYLKTQSLWVVIVLHVINNLFFLIMGDAGLESTRKMLGNDILYFGSFAIAILVTYISYLGIQKLKKENINIPMEV